MKEKLRVGIVGGGGYTAGELVRILINHPSAELVMVHSASQAGKYLYEVHAGLYGDTSMRFCQEVDLDGIDVLFMCGAHGESRRFWEGRSCPEGLKIIDLAQDFRDESCGYVYGLPEWRRDRISSAGKVANPGCFATALQLALLPLAGAGRLPEQVNIQALTGSTGAGVKPGATTHFSWRENNISAYKVFEHQHLVEVGRNLSIVAGRPVGDLNFVPLRGDFPRGIFAVLTMECPLNLEDILTIYHEAYDGEPFTFVSPFPLDLKQVAGTNKCMLFLEKHGKHLVVTSVIDNLLKGASGQAVQNMNIMCGLPETEGLKLKAIAF